MAQPIKARLTTQNILGFLYYTVESFVDRKIGEAHSSQERSIQNIRKSL